MSEVEPSGHWDVAGNRIEGFWLVELVVWPWRQTWGPRNVEKHEMGEGPAGGAWPTLVCTP